MTLPTRPNASNPPRHCASNPAPIPQQQRVWARRGASSGSLTVNPLVEQGIDEVRSTFDTNVIGVINTIRVAAPPMMSHGAGTIAVTGSITADYPTPFGAVYCASKAAVESLCRSVRSELSPFGIHVVHLYTGAVSTDISSNAKKTVPPPPTVAAAAAATDATDAEAGHGDGGGAGGWYGAYHDVIANHPFLQLSGSTTKHAIKPTSACDYAKHVVPRLLQVKPPWEIAYGGRAGYLKWLARIWPKAWMDRRMCDAFIGRAGGEGGEGGGTKTFQASDSDEPLLKS